MKLSFLPLFMIPFQAILNAQVVIRSVATSGMEVPGHPGVTMDGFGKVSMDPGQIIFTAGRRQNNTTIGNLVISWLPGAPLGYLLGSNDVPPLLIAPPSDFLDSQGNPFDEPIAVEIVDLPRKVYEQTTLAVRYRNVGVSGSKIAYISHNPPSHSSFFQREVGTTALGTVYETAEIVMTGDLFAPFTPRIGRGYAFGNDFTPVLEQGMQVKFLEENETLGFLARNNVKWNSEGRISYLGTIDGPGLAFPNNDGLFLEERGMDGLETVARDLERHPSYPDSGLAPDGIFLDVGGISGLEGFSMNDRGELAFFATITDPANAAGSVMSLWYQENGPDTFVAARTGTPVQIQGYGTATFTGLSKPLLTQSGDLVYHAQWMDGATFMSGLIRWQLSDRTHHMLIKKGDSLDGPVAGITLDSPSNIDLKITPSGRVIAKAGIHMPGGAFRQAVIAHRTNGIFHAVAIIGESLVLTDNTDIGIVTAADFPFNTSSNGMDGKPYCFAPNNRFCLLVETSGSLDHLIAFDVDLAKPSPIQEEGVAAGRSENWQEPTGFKETIASEEAQLAAKIAAASDTGTPINLKDLTGLSSSELGRLSRTGQFSREERALALEYLNARRNVLKSIKLAALWDPKRAAWLLEAFRAGRIQFGSQNRSGPRAFAEIRADASADGGNEIITLRFLSTAELSLFDPDLVQMTNSLLHEARHAFQSMPPLNPPNTAAEQAAWADGRHTNELVASNEEVVLVEDLIAGLLGNDSGQMATAIINELNQTLSGAALDVAKDKLLARLQRIRHNAQYTILCREGYSAALQRFLAAGATSQAGDTLKEDLKRLKCFNLYRRTMTEFGEIGVFGGAVIYNPSTNQLESTPTIKQIDTRTGQETSFNVSGGAEYVFDAEIALDAGKLYVGAKTGASGTIFSYLDGNADATYDASTEEVVVASTDLGGGFYLSMDPFGKGLHAYALETGMVYRVNEATNSLETVGQLPPTQDPVLDFIVNGNTVSTSPMPRFETPAPGYFYRLAGYEDLALADESGASDFGALKVSPVIGKAPVEGDMDVVARGQPGQDVRLERSTAMIDFSLESTASFDSEGKAILPLPTPLANGEEIRLVNGYDGSRSAEMPVWPQSRISDSLEALAASDRGLYLEASGTPSGDYKVEWSAALNTWNPAIPFKMSPFGTSVLNDESATVPLPKYFGRIIPVP